MVTQSCKIYAASSRSEKIALGGFELFEKKPDNEEELKS